MLLSDTYKVKSSAIQNNSQNMQSHCIQKGTCIVFFF
ncbi:unnamed protein product [Larinioides sclopetarius]|uniref:Uncharacterized protein n=1 Tax=Larinioides sclopetarius TaxID=280406 RepID=A0AAV2ARW9_9ARAC